ncbi:UNVERIFIED_CONTAM: hypothetical protein Slati_1140900 [Sesamum latifolium]|uniref:Myb/SANT-like domain-containing protein n=1 Tax=Sesamum latifolium TaxID=2727402 RepID=A0AAW2XCU3_9LAMI
MSNNRRPEAQSKYFYSAGWTKDQNNAFMNMLAWQGEMGHKQTNPNQPNQFSLEFASKAVDHWSEKTILMATYINKLQTLRLRYDTYKRILDDPSFLMEPTSQLCKYK